MKPFPVQSIGNDSGARSLLVSLVRILAICGMGMGIGVTLLLLEPVLLVAFGAGSLARHVNWQGYGIPGFPYRGDTVYVSAAAALLLTTASIAALSLRPWGRVGMAWYAIASIAHMGVLLTVPPTYAWYYGMEEGGSKNFINALRDVAIVAAMVVTSLVYPVLVVAVMRHPVVAALFQNEGIARGFEPKFANRGGSSVPVSRSENGSDG
jgi:hypothetical protein